MYLFNQTENLATDTNITSPDLTIVNSLDKYSKNVDTATDKDITLSYSGGEDDLAILGTNASRCEYSIYTVGITRYAEDTTISTNTTVDGKIVIAGGVEFIINTGVTYTIISTPVESTDTLLKKDFIRGNLHFGLKDKALTSATIRLVGSDDIEIGCLIAGNFSNYGYVEDQNNFNGTIKGIIKSSDYEKIQTYLETEDFYFYIPHKTNESKNNLIQYGKTVLSDGSVISDTFSDSENLVNITIKIKE